MEIDIYKASRTKKQKIIKEMKKLYYDKIGKPLKTSNIMFAIIIGLFVVSEIFFACQFVFFKKDTYSAGTEEFMLVTFIELFALAVLLIIPAAIRQNTYRKYMGKWYGRSEEKVIIAEDAVTWCYYSKFKDSDNECGRIYAGNKDKTPYWEYRIEYNDITNIVYDEKEHILYIYGYPGCNVWESSHMFMRTGHYQPDKKEEQHLCLAGYFENFSKMMEKLESTSGQEIIRK